MRNLLLLVFFAWDLISCFAQTTQVSKNEFELLMQKIRQDLVNHPSKTPDGYAMRCPDDSIIERSLRTYNAKDGFFNDVDYDSDRRTFWPPLAHLTRLTDFVFAYTHPQSKFHASETMYQAIAQGLRYWHARNPHCHNWWYNQIAEPQALGLLLIQMRTGHHQLPRELETMLLERMKQDGGNPAKWTGANRTDIALHWIYRACLTENETDLAFAMEQVYSPIYYTTKEGFQHDNSYFQHGRQLYIGGYGDEILKGITQVASYAHETRFAIPADKLDLLSRFMRETYYATIRGRYMSFDVLGRGMSRPQILDKSHTALFARRMMELDPKHAEEFRAIVARLENKEPVNFDIKPKHTHYFRGDYTLHTRPDYMFDVRTVSNRTCRLEYGNDENLKTYFASDGCTNITLDGSEYFDIFPVWNWARIPGTTAPQLCEIPKAKNDWQQPGTSTFAGGVSDSLYGVTTYAYCDDYANIRTSARKSWFFFDREVVCLGAGITSRAEAEVWTTLNQCLSGDKWEVERNGNHWVSHRGIAYIFPQGGDIFLAKQKQQGTWYDINHSHSKDSVEKEIFTLALKHGKQPVDATYTYIVVPNLHSAKAINHYSRVNNIEIAANNKQMQVVRHKQLGLWGLVFYEAGIFTHKQLRVQTDHPCTILIKEEKECLTLHMADPGQTESVINVKVTLPRQSKQTLTFRGDWSGSGIYAGSSKRYEKKF